MNKPSQHIVLCELQPPRQTGLESHSPFCLKAHRALELAGLAHEHAHGDRPDSWKAYNPRGQVPVLLVDGAPIADSTDILKWITAQRPEAFDAALDARGRAEAWLWEEMADTALNGFLVAARWADERNWPVVVGEYFGGAPWFVQKVIAPRVRAGVIGRLVARDVWRGGATACWERFLALLDDLEGRAPADGFWLGRSPGVADVAMFAQLASFRTPLTAWQAREIEKHPRLVDWIDRVDAVTRPVATASAARGPATAARAVTRAPREAVAASA